MEAARFQQRADAAAGPGEMPVGDAPDQGLARGGPDQAERGPQRRCLPRPVGPEEAGDLAGGGGEGHIPDSCHRAKGLRQATDLDLRHRILLVNKSS
jgi:hypothetical protein